MVLFKRKSWPMVFGLGSGFGMAYTNCEQEINKKWLFLKLNTSDSNGCLFEFQFHTYLANRSKYSRIKQKIIQCLNRNSVVVHNTVICAEKSLKSGEIFLYFFIFYLIESIKAVFIFLNILFNIKQCSVMFFWILLMKTHYLFKITLAVGIRLNQHLAKIVHFIKEWYYLIKKVFCHCFFEKLHLILEC